MNHATSSNNPFVVLAADIVAAIDRGYIRNRHDIERYKKKFCKEYAIERIPTNADILNYVPDRQRRLVATILQKKPVRTLSGVAVVAVMTSPFPCPHGRCVPCPGGPPLSAQSYTGEEPAAQRAIEHGYDPFAQTKNRLEQLETVGHPTDKVELIIMGGTFTARDLLFQQWFVHRCYDALNGASSADLLGAQVRNQTAAHRCTGLTIETRPDWCRLQQVEDILHLGTTRVELGAQVLDDRVLQVMQRGHTVADTRDATRLCKDAGLKVCYHIMPGLPGSDADSDMDAFCRLIQEPAFRPDMLKIYPTLVVRPSALFKRWQNKQYTPLQTHEAVERIADMKTLVPPWMRIQRIQRDIPAPLIDAGITKSNLRQLVHDHLMITGRVCRCIRCREAGHQSYKHENEADEISFQQYRYAASGGEEVFISAEDTHKDVLVAYCRLRFPGTSYRPELGPDHALVRELRVTGPMVSIGIGTAADEEWQHRGWGHTLLTKAEQVAADAGKHALTVLSGIGAKPYYRRLGYHDNGVYLSKILT
jgi:elongator complex protein 3